MIYLPKARLAQPWRSQPVDPFRLAKNYGVRRLAAIASANRQKQITDVILKVHKKIA
jgi:hypothetical protein